MASLLQRLGRWCASRRWIVIAAWTLLVALVTVGTSTLSKPLTNEFSIPDSRFEEVLSTLQQEIPEAAGTTATIVLRSATDTPYTDRQEEAISGAVDRWNAIDTVTVIDPFESQDQIDSAADEVTAGRDKLAAGHEEYEAGVAEVESQREQLEQSRAELEAGVDAGMVPPAAEQQARAELTAGEEALAEADAELTAGEQELNEGEAALDAAERMVDLTSSARVVNDTETVAISVVTIAGADGFVPPETTQAIIDVGTGLAAYDVGVDYSKELTDDPSSVVGATETIGLAVAAIVLLVMLGSLIAAGLPLLMSFVGVGVGLLGAMTLTQWISMNSVTPALALMLGLAVGIDYSLFLINRHREQLRAGMKVRESIALAVGTAGNAVTFAGLTVIIALVALTVTGIPFLGVMGLVAAATVLVAVLVATTLTPALLSLVGQRILPRREWVSTGSTGTEEGRSTGGVSTGSTGTEEGRSTGGVSTGSTGTGEGRGWAAWVQRRPWLALVAVLGIVAGMGWPAAQLRLGLPDGSAEPAGSTAYATYDTVRDEFGAGANGPLLVVAEFDKPIADGEPALHNAQADIGEALRDVNGVVQVLPAGVSDDRGTLAFRVQPEGGPAEESTKDLVDRLEVVAGDIGAANDATIGLTGQTVANVDISQQLAEALPVYLLVVVSLSLVLMLLVFRSLVIPLLASGGFLLSLAAAFGAVVAVYQLEFAGDLFGITETGPVLSFLPILLIGILFGLAMDYQVFLVSAMREVYAHRAPGADPASRRQTARTAVVVGFNHSARVVTAAAIIMIAVFGGFIWAHLTMIRPIGLGLAIGVLIDAFLIRMTLTPAVMSLLGERAWWLPRWLDKVLPNVDVEGSSLRRQRHAGPRGVQ